MSFWRDNPCVPTWLGTATAWWNGSPPRILEPSPSQAATPVPGFTLSRGGKDDAPAVCEFLALWFSTSRARCDLPPAVLSKALDEWDLWIVRRNGSIVGTVVRRWIRNAAIGLAVWPRAGIVEYFAVHPAVRKRGIGRWLLRTLQASTPKPIPPHFILWESVGIGFGSIPPLVMGRYWVCEQAASSNPNVKRVAAAAAAVWNTLTAKSFLHSSWTPGSVDLSVWETPAGTVAVQDLFHRSVPDGRRMAMIVAASGAPAVAAFAASSPWPILLADQSWGANWTPDSPFQWIGYNVLAGTVTTAYPCFG